MTRAISYGRQIGASYVFPSAGPPCFLDDDLFHFNDFDRDPANIFPDQTAFLEYMREQGMENGRLTIPGSVATFGKDASGEAVCTIRHPLPEEGVRAIFADKRKYMEDYKGRKQPAIDAFKAGLPRGEVEILPSLKDWFEPLLEQADLHSVGINGRLLLDCDREKVLIDFQRRQVCEWRGEECGYVFRIAPELVEHQIAHHEEDWINSLFLSCRFEAKRRGAYNEYVYNFFKCLSYERLQYLEGYYAENTGTDEMWECAGYRVQRRCPHMKADLTEFGQYADGVLTCMMHGHQFELATGRCLTSDDLRLRTEPIDGAGAAGQADAREPEATPLSRGS
jgi:UDP-MurNAc hydroxylase